MAPTVHLVAPMPGRPSHYGNYQVIAPLATGGMGGVFLASHLTTGKRVALKVLDPLFANHQEVVDRLLSERAISARATHPGLVEIHAASQSIDGVPYLVMEFLDGRTLAAIHGEDPGNVDISTIIGIGAQVAAALAALHDAGVIHCDVKPENIFVLNDRVWGAHPQVKVIDFGVSRRMDEPPPSESSIAGTPAYMAPEQWRGSPSPASDVYSLGCVLYELLTGEVPFEGSLPELMIAHMNKRPARPSWLRAGLAIGVERLIMRALAKDPAMRPTMLELARDLGDLAEAERCSETMPMLAMAV